MALPVDSKDVAELLGKPLDLGEDWKVWLTEQGIVQDATQLRGMALKLVHEDCSIDAVHGLNDTWLVRACVRCPDSPAAPRRR